MKLILSREVIDLPSELTFIDRMELVNKILLENPEDFEYKEKMFDIKKGQRIDTNMNVKVRLDVIGTYLIRSDAQYTDNVMSRYKIKNRNFQEAPFSSLSENIKIGLVQDSPFNNFDALSKGASM